jgi:hypothetical protein
MTSLFRLALPCLFLACPPLAAAPEEAAPVTIRVAAAAISGGIDTLWLAGTAGATPTECRLNIRSFSGEITAKAVGDRLLFHASREAAEADPQGPPVASVKVANTTRMLVLFFPVKDGYQAMWIPDDEAGYGSFVVINTTPSNLMCQVDGAKPAVVKPGERSVIPAPGGKPVQVKLAAVLKEGGAKLIRTSSWQLDANQREFVIVHGDAERAKFHHLVDYRKEEEP